MFEAYITNTALYPMMGIEVGTTVHFPTTTQEVQAALAKIGIDGKRYSEVFITSFDSDVLGQQRGDPPGKGPYRTAFQTGAAGVFRLGV